MNINCRICGGATVKLFSVSGNRNNNDIDVYYCDKCDVSYTNPPAYDYDAPDSGIIDYYKAHQGYIEWRHTKIFEFIEEITGEKAGRFLDIGAGAGYSMRVAESRGWEPSGIEPSKILTEFAQSQSNGNIVQGYFSEELLNSSPHIIKGKFDYILVDNVLEHINDSILFLRAILPLLKQHGVLLVAVPPVDWFRVLLSRIKYIRNYNQSARLNLFYDPEQHVNYFSRKSMRILIQEKLGYQLLESRFHHSRLLNGKFAKFMAFETGYYFISKQSNDLFTTSHA